MVIETMSRKIITFVIVLILIVGVTGVVIYTQFYNPGQSITGPTSIIDDVGRTVTITNYPPERIVALAPSCVEILFAIGSGDKVVGVPEYSDYPPEVPEKVEKLADKYLFITAPEIELDGHVIALKQRKIMPISGDYVFIDRGKINREEKGNTYSIYKKSDRVVHPITGEYLGIIVTKVGELQVTHDIQDDNTRSKIKPAHGACV